MFSLWSPGAHDLLCYISQWPAEAHCHLQYRTCLHSNGHIRWMSPKPRWTRQLSCPLTVTSLLEYCAVTVRLLLSAEANPQFGYEWRWILCWFRWTNLSEGPTCSRDLQKNSDAFLWRWCFLLKLTGIRNLLTCTLCEIRFMVRVENTC
jgi:hypothetical protein